MRNTLLAGAPLYYPSARKWMWDYCIYLGPFTDSDGKNYDLGVFISDDHFCNATVFGNEPEDYSSGLIHPRIAFDNEVVQEVIRRAKQLNLIK